MLHPKLNSLPDEPLRKGEQYYLDLAGNIQKGPVGVPTCYCGPVLHRLECRLAKDKQEILHRLDSAHMRLDAKIDGLERKTQQQLQGLQRTVDCLGLESSAAGLQRVRNSIVMADPGHATPPLPNLELTSNSSAASTSQKSRKDSQPLRNSATLVEEEEQQQQRQEEEERVEHQQMLSNGHESQYTMDRLGLDGAGQLETAKQQTLQELKNRLALSRIQEQLELESIVDHYEMSSHYNGHSEIGEEDEEDEESEESDEEGDMMDNMLPPPAMISSEKAASMLSDSR